MDINTAKEALRLDKQLCFPIYAASREVIKQYHPCLTNMNLTYTQYLVMMVLWEKSPVTEKEMGRRLHLDSGTLTPVLKSLEAKGFIRRSRSKEDERVVCVFLSDDGAALEERAVGIPGLIQEAVPLSDEEKVTLTALLNKILSGVEE